MQNRRVKQHIMISRRRTSGSKELRLTQTMGKIFAEALLSIAHIEFEFLNLILVPNGCKMLNGLWFPPPISGIFYLLSAKSLYSFILFSFFLLLLSLFLALLLFSYSPLFPLFLPYPTFQTFEFVFPLPMHSTLYIPGSKALHIFQYYWMNSIKNNERWITVFTNLI